ncbi:type I phosphomannose isomerase catalytic subunit [Marinigracilibium pacificum]|nr:type I phosphomannose isomerase catalytic subunit [Marinigracilibium pacificum]
MPLKFHPILKEKIWGGRKLGTLLNKPLTGDEPIGESWEISGVPGDVSVVNGGPFDGIKLTELIERFPVEILGERVYKKYGRDFPLLFKFIDAAQDLSVQVHPDDALAMKKHSQPFGKNEMWYIISAEEGSTLVSGFKENMSRDKFQKMVEEGKVADTLLNHEVEEGDVYDIPAGRIHTIGKGILLAEIQQSSDLTYRVYDFDRVDTNGNKRELHIDDAYEALDYEYKDQYKVRPATKPDTSDQLVANSYFDVKQLTIQTETSITPSALGSFVVLMAIEGTTEIVYNGETNLLPKGKTILLPAACSEIKIKAIDGQSKLLQTCISES